MIKTFKEFMTEADEEVWYHGTDKKLSGNLMKNAVKKTWDDFLSFDDFLPAFFVTKDISWAKIYTKNDTIYEILISPGYKYLDMSNIKESTHLSNKLLMTNKSGIDSEFIFQNDFDDFAFTWINKERKRNNKRLFDKQEYFDRDIHLQFKPNLPDWFDGGIGEKALKDYVEQNKFDTILFEREMIILNTDIIKSYNIMQ